MPVCGYCSRYENETAEKFLVCRPSEAFASKIEKKGASVGNREVLLLPKRRKKSRWSLQRIRVGFNVLIGKMDAEFEKNEIPRKPTRMQRSKIKIELGTELARITKDAGQPKNVVADTISEIANKERKKAIRSGDYGLAIFASVIQYYVD